MHPVIWLGLGVAVCALLIWIRARFASFAAQRPADYATTLPKIDIRRHLSGSDQTTFSSRDARIAFHSLSATTPKKFSRQTTVADNPEIELSSTDIGTAPATLGRIIRPCSMPGTTI